MAVENGTNIVITWDSGVITGQTDSNISMTLDAIETSNKSTSPAKTFIPGDYQGSIDFTTMYDEAAATESFSDLFADFIAGTNVTVLWGGIDSGDTYYSASGFLTTLNASAPYNDVASFDGTIQLTGAITTATVA